MKFPTKSPDRKFDMKKYEVVFTEDGRTREVNLYAPSKRFVPVMVRAFHCSYDSVLRIISIVNKGKL